MGGVRVLPGMRMTVGMGGHGLTLKNGGVVQGRCLESGGGGEQEGESGKPIQRRKRMWVVELNVQPLKDYLRVQEPDRR